MEASATPDPDAEPPEYSTDYMHALWYVYLLSLGEFGTDAFETGDSVPLTVILKLYFALASFLLLIHLLNMLIAIMGETFAANNEIKHQQ